MVFLQKLDAKNFLIYLSYKWELSYYNLRAGMIQQLESGSNYSRP